MEIMTMGTTRRHMKILDWFSGFAIKEQEKDYFVYGREQIALVENYGALIDVSELTDEKRQKVRNVMGKMKYTYPDFMIFKHNPVIINDQDTRYAGIPDLIIEVWSRTNSNEEKEQKRKLYRTSKSEFWEINQDSPKVICWAKDGTKYEQFMNKPLVTPWKEEFDLTDLSHDVIDILPNDRFHGGSDIGKDFDL